MAHGFYVTTQKDCHTHVVAGYIDFESAVGHAQRLNKTLRRGQTPYRVMTRDTSNLNFSEVWSESVAEKRSRRQRYDEEDEAGDVSDDSDEDVTDDDIDTDDDDFADDDDAWDDDDEK